MAFSARGWAALALLLACGASPVGCSRSDAPASAEKAASDDAATQAAAPAAAKAPSAEAPPPAEPAPAAPASGSDARASRPPNVVLISIDTLRSDHTSTYGYEKETTPTLSAVAKEGVRVKHAYSHTATTGPSHSTLFTSLYPLAHGVEKNGTQLSTEHPVLAEVMWKNGYQTAAFVSSYVLKDRFGFARGFESYDDEFEPVGTGATTKCAQSRLERCADQTSEKVTEWLERRDDGRPFFLFVHLFDPHSGYDPPAEFVKRFRDPPAPSANPDDPAATPAEIDRRARRFANAMKSSVFKYDGEIAFADQEIGNILQALARKGLEKDTLVVITADHGEGLGQHGALTHGVNLNEEMLRIPLVFRWPGHIPAGVEVDAPVGLVDVSPTILELAGISSSSIAPQGQSVASAVLGQKTLDLERPLFFQRRFFESENVGGVAVKGGAFGERIGRWKYVESDAEGKGLFDLEADPHEDKNLVDAMPERATAMAEKLHQWQASARRSAGEAAPAPVSDEDRAKLRALGYVD